MLDQRLAMMTLNGQHGQQQDYMKGLALLRQAAAVIDDNAPQAAYVRVNDCVLTMTVF
jgi:hypothetical protein